MGPIEGRSAQGGPGAGLWEGGLVLESVLRGTVHEGQSSNGACQVLAPQVAVQIHLGGIGGGGALVRVVVE